MQWGNKKIASSPIVKNSTRCHCSLNIWYYQMLKIVIGIDYNKIVWGENIFKASILEGEVHYIIILKAMRHNTGTEKHGGYFVHIFTGRKRDCFRYFFCLQTC